MKPPTEQQKIAQDVMMYLDLSAKALCDKMVTMSHHLTMEETIELSNMLKRLIELRTQMINRHYGDV